MKLAIADPPYLGCADRWYGSGRANGGGRGRASNHPAAAEWDDPARHTQLVHDLDREYDGWAVAMNAHSLGIYAAAVDLSPASGYRIGAWVKPNRVPSGSRIAQSWEPVLFHVPRPRRAHGTGVAVDDSIRAAAPCTGFAGAKPAAWTRWVLDILGYQDGDEVADIFPGSGAVDAEVRQLVIV